MDMERTENIERREVSFIGLLGGDWLKTPNPLKQKQVMKKNKKTVQLSMALF